MSATISPRAASLFPAVGLPQVSPSENALLRSVRLLLNPEHCAHGSRCRVVIVATLTDVTVTRSYRRRHDYAQHDPSIRTARQRMQLQRHSSQLYCSTSRFLHAAWARTNMVSSRSIICMQPTGFGGATAALVRTRRWLGGGFTFLQRVHAALSVRRCLYFIAAASMVIADATSSHRVRRRQNAAASASAGRRSVFSHLPRSASQQQQLHLI